MRITIKDIAKRAGVSHTTVSRALNGHSAIPEKTTASIRQLAAEMGYRPSQSARSLKTHRTQALGVVLSSISDPFFSEMLEGVESAAQACEYSLFIAASQHDPSRERMIVRTMVEHQVDGVIICSTPFSSEQAHQLREFGVPIVVVNNQAAEEYRYSLYHDDEYGSCLVTHHLIGLGHHRIAYLGNAASGRTTQDRYHGYMRAMQAANLPIPSGYILEVAHGSPESGMASLDHFLNLPILPTAFVCFNDAMAIGLLTAIQAAGYMVPDQISITGFDNIAFSAFSNPPLTTFDQPKRALGEQAVRLLIDLLKPGPAEKVPEQPNIQVMRGSLLIRKSTAPPPGEE